MSYHESKENEGPSTFYDSKKAEVEVIENFVCGQQIKKLFLVHSMSENPIF